MTKLILRTFLKFWILELVRDRISAKIKLIIDLQEVFYINVISSCTYYGKELLLLGSAVLFLYLFNAYSTIEKQATFFTILEAISCNLIFCLRKSSKLQMTSQSCETIPFKLSYLDSPIPLGVHCSAPSG